MSAGEAPRPAPARRRSRLRTLLPFLIGLPLGVVAWWLLPEPGRSAGAKPGWLHSFDTFADYLGICVFLATLAALPRMVKVLARDAVPAKWTDLWGYLFLAVVIGCIVYFNVDLLVGW